MSAPDTADVTFTAPPGGVMTRDVGAVTGDLRCRAHSGSGTTRVEVAYVGSDDWYEVTGSPTKETVTAAAAAEALSTDPGLDSDGNPASTRL